MADKPNLNKLFRIETELPPPSYVPPLNGGVDDISIVGLSGGSSIRSLFELVRLEFAERYEYMPHAIYAPAVAQNGVESMRVFFKEPIDSDLALEIFSDCTDAIAAHLGVSTDNVYLCTQKTGLYDRVRARILDKREGRSPDEPDGPIL